MIVPPIKSLFQCNLDSLPLSSLHGSLWRETLLFVAALWVLEHCADIPHEASPLKWNLGPSVFPYGSGSPALIIFVTLLWTLSNLSAFFFNCESQNWTQYSRRGLRRSEWKDNNFISASSVPVNAAWEMFFWPDPSI